MSVTTHYSVECSGLETTLVLIVGLIKSRTCADIHVSVPISVLAQSDWFNSTDSGGQYYLRKTSRFVILGSDQEEIHYKYHLTVIHGKSEYSYKGPVISLMRSANEVRLFSLQTSNMTCWLLLAKWVSYSQLSLLIFHTDRQKLLAGTTKFFSTLMT